MWGGVSSAVEYRQLHMQLLRVLLEQHTTRINKSIHSTSLASGPTTTPLISPLITTRFVQPRAWMYCSWTDRMSC